VTVFAQFKVSAARLPFLDPGVVGLNATQGMGACVLLRVPVI